MKHREYEELLRQKNAMIEHLTECYEYAVGAYAELKREIESEKFSKSVTIVLKTNGIRELTAKDLLEKSYSELEKPVKLSKKTRDKAIKALLNPKGLLLDTNKK